MRNKRKSSQERLIHVQNAISEIERFILDVNEIDFIENTMLNNAVLMQFIVIGEAIFHVDEQILSAHDYPWYKVKSFRNFIAHEYFNVKLSAVWQTAKSDLPTLKLLIHRILTTEFPHE